MKREHWSSDQNKIHQMINSIIDAKYGVTLQRQGGETVRSRLVRIHYHNKKSYLLLLRPPNLCNSWNIMELLCKVRGMPIVGFSCPITREGNNLMATLLPQTVFQIELRNNSRLVPLEGSMATFFIKGRSKVSICKVANMSMGGIKLVGTPTHTVGDSYVIGPCTLSLAGPDALISREVTVNKAIVTRVEPNGHGPSSLEMGVKFELSDNERAQLKEHLDFFNG